MQMPTDGRTTDDKAMLGGRTDCIMGYCNPATYKQRARCGRKLNRNKEVYVCMVPISVSLTVDPIRAAALLRLRASGEEDLQWDGWLAGWTYNLTMVEVQCEVERYC